jgi:hypothetical protein
MTTGSKNTIIGRYDGNQGGLDIRTASNNIVLSDGDGNPRVIVDSSGNLVVGGTSAQASDAATLMADGEVTAAGFYFSNNIGAAMNDTGIRRATTSTMVFDTASTERMRIDSSGNLIVGKSSQVSAGRFGVQYDSGQHGIGIDQDFSGSGTLINFLVQNSAIGSIQTNGTTTSYVTSSDYRLKTDAQPMVGASARVLALKPVNFAWKADGTRVDGFLAHEAQAVVPECVTGTKDAVDEDGNPVYQGIDQSKLVPLLTAALQEALTKIEALEARITALESA